MRYLTGSLLAVVLGFGLATTVAGQEPKPPVRAKEPTVVTVEGKAEQVEPDRRKPQSSEGAVGRTARSVARAPIWLGKRIADWLDFNWGGDNVVPAEREKRQKDDRRSR